MSQIHTQTKLESSQHAKFFQVGELRSQQKAAEKNEHF